MKDETRERLEEEDKKDAVSRREFLEVMAAGFGAIAASGCKLRPPKAKIVPLSEGIEGYTPGLAKWYATTCSGCSAACGVIAKSRDGRPIKLEGNPDHPLSRGGLCARGQATLLDLYDAERLRGPLLAGAACTWEALDAEVRAGLQRAAREGKGIRVLTSTLAGPSERAALDAFLKKNPGATHVAYDALSSDAILESHRLTHGKRVLPHYRFNLARAIVSFDADFLGTWISPVEFTRDWAANRRPGPGREGMSWFAQFEARMSVTGANADLRVPCPPSQELATALALGRRVARGLSWKGTLPYAGEETSVSATLLNRTAAALIEAAGRALVVSGSGDVAVQVAVNWLNEMLGAYGNTVDIALPSLQREGGPGLEALTAEMERGAVAALIVWGANPLYDNPAGARFAAALKKVETVVCLAERNNETARLAHLVAALPHSLETWGDAEPVAGVQSLYQPLVAPLFDSRPALESLLVWAGHKQEAHEFVRERWRVAVHPRVKSAASFDSFWDDALRLGAVTLPQAPATASGFNAAALTGLKPARRSAPDGAFELVAYPSVALADGRQANNPWLQELPDAVSRVSWGNYLSFSPKDAERLGVVEGRVVRLATAGGSVELPAHVQPGQAAGVAAGALGYGRDGAGKIAANYPMVKMFPIEKDLLAGADLYPFFGAASVTVELTGRMSPLAKVQIQDSLTDPILHETRPAVRETTLAAYAKDAHAAAAPAEEGNGLWPRHEYKGHKWGMSIDMNACTGCNACVIACQAENNIPVVGMAEVRKSRDMAWLRIDRYYSEAASEESPDVAFQPMLCQHCDNAPCETVCPVLATVHSSEGLNMQVYNRCVGTRYCANNCPFKVRRFNWFDYAHQDLLQNLALNPDVTVRSRGVMEKCSFCVQRIYTSEADAKVAGRAMKDGDVKSACQQSCPAEAIVFGDLNDPDSRVAKLAKSDRGYRVLSELGVGPSIFYQAKVRNKKVS